MKVSGVRCPHCKDEIWARHRHDLRRCGCGYCYVDGGRSYLRIGYGGPDWAEPWTPPETIELEVPG